MNEIILYYDARSKKHQIIIRSYSFTEMGVACGAYGGGERRAQGSGAET